MNEDLKFVMSMLCQRPNKRFNKSKLAYLAYQSGFSILQAQLDPMFEKVNIQRQQKPGGYYYEYWYVSSHRRREIECLLKK